MQWMRNDVLSEERTEQNVDVWQTLMSVTVQSETVADSMECVMDSLHQDHTRAPVTTDSFSILWKMTALVSLLMFLHNIKYEIWI